jgi:hypothetical protein
MSGDFAAHPIDYWAIREAIRRAIRTYPELGQIEVHLEPSGDVPPERCPCVLLFMTGRSTPDELQRISAGKRTDHRLVFSAWVIDYSLDTLEAATRRRDAVLTKVELALMVDRTLGGLVRGLYLEGGLVEFGKDPKSPLFATAIETLITCDVYASL